VGVEGHKLKRGDQVRRSANDSSFADEVIDSDSFETLT
jgi:hypothetical protein